MKKRRIEIASSIVNLNFLSDKNRFNELFRSSGKIIPNFFVTQRNLLSSINNVQHVFKHVDMYLNGHFTISDIKDEIKKSKPKKKKKKRTYKPRAWIVKKK